MIKATDQEYEEKKYVWLVCIYRERMNNLLRLMKEATELENEWRKYPWKVYPERPPGTSHTTESLELRRMLEDMAWPVLEILAAS